MPVRRLTCGARSSIPPSRSETSSASYITQYPGAAYTCLRCSMKNRTLAGMLRCCGYTLRCRSLRSRSHPAQPRRRSAVPAWISHDATRDRDLPLSSDAIARRRCNLDCLAPAVSGVGGARDHSRARHQYFDGNRARQGDGIRRAGLEAGGCAEHSQATGLNACAYRTLSGRGHQTRRKRRKREAGLSGHLEGQGQSRPRHKC